MGVARLVEVWWFGGFGVALAGCRLKVCGR